MLINQLRVDPIGRLGLGNIFEPLLLYVNLEILREEPAGILHAFIPGQHELNSRLLGGEGGQDRSSFAVSIVRMTMAVRSRSDEIRFSLEGTFLERYRILATGTVSLVGSTSYACENSVVPSSCLGFYFHVKIPEG